MDIKSQVTIKATGMEGEVVGIYEDSPGPRQYCVKYIDRAGNVESRWFHNEKLEAR